MLGRTSPEYAPELPEYEVVPSNKRTEISTGKLNLMEDNLGVDVGGQTGPGADFQVPTSKIGHCGRCFPETDVKGAMVATTGDSLISLICSLALPLLIKRLADAQNNGRAQGCLGTGNTGGPSKGHCVLPQLPSPLVPDQITGFNRDGI